MNYIPVHGNCKLGTIRLSPAAAVLCHSWIQGCRSRPFLTFPAPPPDVFKFLLLLLLLLLLIHLILVLVVVAFLLLVNWNRKLEFEDPKYYRNCNLDWHWYLYRYEWKCLDFDWLNVNNSKKIENYTGKLTKYKMVLMWSNKSVPFAAVILSGSNVVPVSRTSCLASHCLNFQNVCLLRCESRQLPYTKMSFVYCIYSIIILSVCIF